MEYTHYFQLHEGLTQTAWNAFNHGIEQLVDTTDVPLHFNLNPVQGMILLNGTGADSHEALVLERGSLKWKFCNTAHKPYDEVVTAILILARYSFDTFTLSSDGPWDEWVAGRELFTRVFHLEPAEGTVFGNQEHNYNWKAEVYA